MKEMIRIKTHENVITFPATKVAGVLTYSGDVKYDFENSSYGPIDIHLHSDDMDDITNTLTISVYVSYDEGTTWDWVADYADLANGAGAEIDAIYASAIKYAPRVRLDAIFDGTGALVAGHGCKVSVRTSEIEIEYRRKIFYDIGDVPATMANTDTNEGTSCYVPNIIDPFRKIVVIATALDLSKITDDFEWKLQSSYDNVNWFDATSLAAIAASTGEYFLETEVTAKLGKYARVFCTCTGGAGALATGHGIEFSLIGLYS
ncbi:MAG TPA: hypothetical protein VMZ91_01970 [Candidatus Paceibacterota bacterium]|nr:hypothetical protein [Candidatus Paceibacterota bacterium]